MDIKRFRPAFIKNELQEADLRGNRKCLMCKTMLMKTVRYYCSGDCMTEARKIGRYGHEDELEEEKVS